VKIFATVGIDPAVICGALKVCPQKEGVPQNKELEVVISSMKKKLLPKTGFNLPKGQDIGYFLHISDMHPDPLYKIGSNQDCVLPLCCREYDGKGSAGKWGDYNCDIPIWTFMEMFDQIQEIQPQPDFVLITGDYTPHDVWNQTKDDIINRLHNVSAILRKYYPDTPVFFINGNHDAYPVDQYNTHPIDSAHLDDFVWSRELFAQEWATWLPEDALKTILIGNYYTALARPGLRIVAINTQWGDNLNFYLLLQENNQQNQTDWLTQVLLSAREAQEKVLIIGHIPSGLTFEGPYVQNYLDLVTTFSDVVAGQFFGHTHEDQFEVVNDINGSPVGVLYIAPSVTTFANRNPSFRFYQYDTSTFEVLDYYQYIMNLTDANLTDKPQWVLEYSALSEYSMTDLSPSSWMDLTNRMENDDELFQTWFRNYMTQVPATCTGTCVEQYLCGLRNAAPVNCD